MKKKSKILLIVLTFFLTSFISFVIGVNLGFSDGYSLLSDLRCSTNAFYYTITLESLRDQKIDQVINSMESKLDGSIIEHNVKKKPSFAFFFIPLSHIFNFDSKEDLSLFKKTIAYRKQYPSTNENNEIRNIIASHLKEIEEELKKTKTMESIEIIIEKICKIPFDFNSLGNISVYDLLKESGYNQVRNQITTKDITNYLKDKPEIINDWLQYSDDKRSPGYYLAKGRIFHVIGNTEENEKSNRIYFNLTKACANFIKLEIDRILE